MDRRRFIKFAAVTGVAALHPSLTKLSASPIDYDAAIVIDACGGPGRVGVDSDRLTEEMIQDVRSSGVTCVNTTVGYVGNKGDLEAFQDICQGIANWEKEIDRHPNVFLKVKSAKDINEAKSTRRLGLIYGLQDGVAFQHDLKRLEILYGLGVRVVQPTYNVRNLIGDGCMEPGNAGLSRIGQDVVKKMNELRVLIDLSHCGRQTTKDVLSLSTQPVAFTHTGCTTIHDHPRNKTDEELQLLAKKGGVAGIYFMPYLRQTGQPTSEDVIRHLEHAIHIAGEDHVGIGTDQPLSPLQLTKEFVRKHKEDIARRRELGINAPGESEDVYLYIPDLNTTQRLNTLAEMLSKRGHSSERIGKILGGNFHRLLTEVWQ
jgi:membrane dipeptidase